MAEDKSKEKELDIKDIEKIFDDFGVQSIKGRKPYESVQSNDEDEILTIRLSNSTNAMITLC